MYVVTHVKTHGFSYEVLFVCETLEHCIDKIYSNLDFREIKPKISRTWFKDGISRLDYGSPTGYYEIHKV